MFKITPKDIVALILYSIPNTILSFGILYIINNAVSGNAEFITDYMGMVFIAVIVYTYLLNIVFQKKLNQYSFNMLYKNEKRIFNEILQTPLRKLETLGSQRFFTVVEDLRAFAWLPETITHTVNSLLMIVLCLVYMFTLSVKGALIVIGLIIVLVAVYLLVIRTMSNQLATLREYNEDYYQYVDDVIKGFKELKANKNRRNNLMGRFLTPNRDKAEKLDFKINYIFLSINLISNYGLYFVIGIILFIFPEWGVLNRADVIAYVIIILFIAGPVNNLINLQNMYTRFIVANRRINKFLEDFKNTNANKNIPQLLTDTFQSIEFKDVYFSYQNENSDEAKSFALGPINLRIEQGETLFVIGGNGSGKSTFINILTGLYKPTKGEIILNGNQIHSGEEFQQLIATVFTNNHIFSHNYDEFSIEGNKDYQNLLEIMKLESVIKDDKEESARRNFSKGQSKRMSMIFSLLEKKPVLILDEWAADQDPHFRKYFYEVLIPELKKQGKTIIAVTHDDAYFKYADRIVKFTYGQIEKDFLVKESVLASENLW